MSLSMELNLELPVSQPGWCYCCGARAIRPDEAQLPLCLECAEYLEAAAHQAAHELRLKNLDARRTVNTMFGRRPAGQVEILRPVKGGEP